LELINLNTFVPHLPKEGTFDENEEQAKSAIILANNKLLELAIEKCETTLFVTYTGGQQSTNAVDDPMSLRIQMPEIYNVLWDFCMDQNKLDLDCRVLMNTEDFKDKSSVIKENQVTLIINSGLEIDTACLQSKDLPSSVQVVTFQDQLKDFVAGDRYVLYDNYHARPMPKYQHLCLGGTFDQLHNGHKKLLTVGIQMCTEKMVIGITGDEMLKKKKNREMIQSIKHRMSNVEKFVKSMRSDIEYDILEISDPWGPAIVRPELEAIVVSSETIGGARMINEMRNEKKMKPLATMAVLRSNIHTLSSTFVRNNSKSSQTNKL